MPRYGYSLEATRSVLFLYVTIGQLVIAYPSRRMVTAPEFNIALHLSVILDVGLQLLTVFLPGLRVMLGLELLGLEALLWVAAAVAVSWGVAAITVCSANRGERA